MQNKWLEKETKLPIIILFIENKAHDIRHMSLVNLTSYHTVIPGEHPVMWQDVDKGGGVKG